MNCTLGSEGQLEALEHISRVEIGNCPPQKMLSSLFHLARLLETQAKVEAARDGRVVVPGFGNVSGRISEIFWFQQRPNYLSEECAPLISKFMYIS